MAYYSIEQNILFALIFLLGNAWIIEQYHTQLQGSNLGAYPWEWALLVYLHLWSKNKQLGTYVGVGTCSGHYGGVQVLVLLLTLGACARVMVVMCVSVTSLAAILGLCCMYNHSVQEYCFLPTIQ